MLRGCAPLSMTAFCAQDPRLLTYDLRIRYEDSNKVDKITGDIVAFFESHPGVDLKLPYKATLKDIATYSVDISITVGTLTWHFSPEDMLNVSC